MYKGAVFFDYDGTLTDENNCIYSPTPKTITALERLRANGYATILATGRMKALTTLVSGKFTGLITSNGSYCEIEGKCISSISIPRPLIETITAYMEKENICYAFETSRYAYANNLDDSHFNSVLNHFKLAKSLFLPIPQNFDKDIYKIIITYDSEDKLNKMTEKFDSVFSIKPHRYCLSADVNDIKISKATGVEAVINHLGISKENTYAFGDGANDATMFKQVAHPVAMGDHSSMLDSCCEFVTGTVKEDGIYTAISEKFKLI